MQEFSAEGVRQMFGGPIFEDRNEILLLGKALKLWGKFSKICIKMKNIQIIIEKIRRKCKPFRIF